MLDTGCLASPRNCHGHPLPEACEGLVRGRLLGDRRRLRPALQGLLEGRGACLQGIGKGQGKVQVELRLRQLHVQLPPSLSPDRAEADRAGAVHELSNLADNLARWASDWLTEHYVDNMVADIEYDRMEWCEQHSFRILRRRSFQVVFSDLDDRDLRVRVQNICVSAWSISARAWLARARHLARGLHIRGSLILAAAAHRARRSRVLLADPANDRSDSAEGLRGSLLPDVDVDADPGRPGFNDLGALD